MAAIPHNPPPDPTRSQDDQVDTALNTSTPPQMLSRNADIIDSINETIERSNYTDLGHFRVECFSQFAVLADELRHIEVGCLAFQSRLIWHEQDERMYSRIIAHLRPSPTEPGILISDLDDAILLGYLEAALRKLDSAHRGVDSAISGLKVYFDQLDEFEQEVDEVCGKLLEVGHQSPDHEVYLHSHHAAILGRATSLKNKILALIRSHW